jgi:molybdopterin converting factor subunit 1
MNVRVLYFAGVRDAIGVAEETLELPENVATVGELARFIAERYEPLRERMASVRVARNERFADDSERIADGDVLALIPPVSGG